MQSYRENYLIHYGVLGMKWGQRKAKPYTSSYTKAYRQASTTQSKKAAKYKAKADKLSTKYNAKAAKATSKSKELSKYANKSAELDKKTIDRLNKQNAGKKIASTLLSSPANPLAYNTMRAAGVSRGKAIAKSIIMTPTYGELSARNKYVKGK